MISLEGTNKLFFENGQFGLRRSTPEGDQALPWLVDLANQLEAAKQPFNHNLCGQILRLQLMESFTSPSPQQQSEYSRWPEIAQQIYLQEGTKFLNTISKNITELNAHLHQDVSTVRKVIYNWTLPRMTYERFTEIYSVLDLLNQNDDVTKKSFREMKWDGFWKQQLEARQTSKKLPKSNLSDDEHRKQYDETRQKILDGFDIQIDHDKLIPKRIISLSEQFGWNRGREVVDLLGLAVAWHRVTQEEQSSSSGFDLSGKNQADSLGKIGHVGIEIALRSGIPFINIVNSVRANLGIFGQNDLAAIIKYFKLYCDLPDYMSWDQEQLKMELPIYGPTATTMAF